MTKIAIIDYGMGNLRSVYKAFLSLGFNTVVTSDKKIIENASHIVLPGVGAFRDAIHELKRQELTESIDKVVQAGKPFLGICLGMQLLFDKSFENGEYEGLGLVEGEVIRFRTEGLKVPHMGWNTLEITKPEPLFSGVPNGSYVYFVHSYHLETRADVVSSYTTYGERIGVSVQKDNIFGIQFHPEKSHNIGLMMLKNFGGIKG